MDTLKSKIEKNIIKLKKQARDNEAQLKKDNRGDEALIEKIRGNIADIYLSVLNVSYHQVTKAGGSDKDLVEKFSKFFEVIPTSWEESKKLAEANNDYEAKYKEDAKIAMAKKIQEIFIRTVEENDV